MNPEPRRGDSAAAPRETATAASPIVAAMVIAALGLHAAFLLVPSIAIARGIAIGAAALTVVSAVTRVAKAMHVTLLVALMTGWVAFGGLLVWPLYFVVPLVAYAFAARTVRPLRRTWTWSRRGRFDRDTVLQMITAVIVSSAALMLWRRFFHPDLHALREQIPDVGPLALAGIGVAFAIGNAILEECIWRGVILEGLDAGLGPGVASVCIQAASFGVAHIAGFPRGAIGVAMAAIYGLMLGAIRRKSGGLMAPIVTHVFADAVIFGLLMRDQHLPLPA